MKTWKSGLIWLLLSFIAVWVGCCHSNKVEASRAPERCVAEKAMAMAPPEITPTTDWGDKDPSMQVRYRFVSFQGRVAIQGNTGALRIIPNIEEKTLKPPKVEVMSSWGEKDGLTYTCYRFVKIHEILAIQSNEGDIELLENGGK